MIGTLHQAVRLPVASAQPPAATKGSGSSSSKFTSRAVVGRLIGSLARSQGPGPAVGLSGHAVRWRALTASREGIECAAAGGGGGSGNGSGSGGGGSGGSSGGGGGGDGKSSNPMAIWTNLFAILVGAGGLAAFLKKGSAKSLFAGLAVGFALLFCGTLMGDPTNAVGPRLALLVVAALGVFMGLNFKESRKPHAGGIAALCGIMSIGYLFDLLVIDTM